LIDFVGLLTRRLAGDRGISLLVCGKSHRFPRSNLLVIEPQWTLILKCDISGGIQDIWMIFVQRIKIVRFDYDGGISAYLWSHRDTPCAICQRRALGQLSHRLWLRIGPGVQCETVAPWPLKLNSAQPVDLLNSVIYCQYSIGLLWAWWAAKNLVRTIKVQQKIRHRKNSIAEKISDNLSDNQHFHFKVFFLAITIIVLYLCCILTTNPSVVPRFPLYQARGFRRDSFVLEYVRWCNEGLTWYTRYKSQWT